MKSCMIALAILGLIAIEEVGFSPSTSYADSHEINPYDQQKAASQNCSEVKDKGTFNNNDRPEPVAQPKKVSPSQIVPPKPVYPHPMIVGLLSIFFLGLLLLVLMGIRPKEEKFILKLPTSFFFFLGILYLSALACLAALYINNVWAIQSVIANPIGGVLPVAVPWFGALGAVLVSLKGVFDHSSLNVVKKSWDPAYNYWHIARPLIGAIFGTVSYFFFLVLNVISVPNDFPKIPNFAEGNFTFYYIVSFLVGFREESFWDLLKRMSELILKSKDSASVAVAVPKLRIKRRSN